MDQKGKIEQLLNDNSFNQAIRLFEQTSPNNFATIESPVSFKFYYSIARGYYLLADYQKSINVLAQLALKNPIQKYQVKMLEFKAKFLFNGEGLETLNQLQSITKGKQFEKYHLDQIISLIKFMQTRERSLSRSELHTQYQQYEQLHEKQTQRGAFSFEAFPMFLVSKRWFEKWKAHVGCDAQSLGRDHPGPISNFQIVEHQYSLLHDTSSQKSYTNQQLFTSAEFVILTKALWNFLHEKYGGIEVKRWNISMLERPDQTITEVWLKKIQVAKHQEHSKTFFIQISRKENWKGLQKKLNRIWGKGRVLKFNRGIMKVFSIINMNNTFQQQDLSDLVLIFESPLASGKYKLDQVLESKPNSTTIEKCANCGKTQNLSFCQCKTIKYCNMDCLVQHRPKHRKQCQSRLQQESQRNQIVSKFNLKNTVNFSGRKGVVGLRNLGNTCYMNSGIQCLSNTRQVSEYFMNGSFMADLNVSNPLGSNGYLTCSYSKLIRQMWSGSDSDVSPWDLKKAISKFAPQFSGFGQHDSQQLISTLIDGLHEDVNKIKQKPIISQQNLSNENDEVISQKSWDNYRSRNLSFISKLFTGQFKSTLTCPKCKRISISFDPFMLISLPLPIGLQTFLYFIPKQLQQAALKMDITIHPLASIQDILKGIRKHLGIAKENQFIVLQINRDYEIKAQFELSDSAEKLYRARNMIFCYEVPPSSAGQLYNIKYYINSQNTYEMKSFPRLYRSKQKPSPSVILESLRRCIKLQKSNCSPDEHFTISYEQNNDVKVYLKQNLKLASYKEFNTPQAQIDLKDCFNLFIKEEKLDKSNQWYCNKCKLFVEANKLMQIYHVNKILVIGLKRFKVNRKLKCFIKFPIVGLNMTDYVLGHKNKEQRLLYDLYAVSNHYGSLGGGHYTAYCKNFLNGKWYQFNDSRISQINESEVVSCNAYVLFYRRRQA